MTRPTLIDLNPDKYNQELRCYPFMVKLDRCKEVVILMIHSAKYVFLTKQK